MATYFTDSWSSLTGWTSRWRGDTWTAADDITAPSGGANDWNAITQNSVDGDANRANVDTLFVVNFSNLSARRYVAVVRGSGADEAATNYSVALSTTSIRIYYCSGSDTPTQVTSATATVTVNTSTDYWVRFRANSTALKAKIWSGAAGDEPGGVGADSNWDISVTDSNVTAAGWVGLSAYGADGFTTWKQFGVGTNGDTAPSSAGGGGATGTLAATESGSDTAALTGDVLIDGALAATESGSDTAALTGDVIVQGALAVTESGTDTAAATGLVLVQGALAATESGSDTAALAGLVLVQGSIASVEPGADTASIAGDVLVSGALAASETGSDTAAFTGDASLGIFGSIDAAESGSDSAQVTGLVLIQGGLAVTETGSDTAAITGPAAVSGSIAATETGSDTAAVTGLVLIYGSLATTETGSDTAAVSSFRPTVPGIEYTLPEGKAHYTLPDGRAHYTIAA